jgi:hypothetical protein
MFYQIIKIIVLNTWRFEFNLNLIMKNVFEKVGKTSFLLQLNLEKYKF